MVPEDVVTAFDRGKRVPVVVTIDGGYQYRNDESGYGIPTDLADWSATFLAHLRPR